LIKINLLPIESFKQATSGKLSVSIFVVVVVAVGIGLYFFDLLIMDSTLAKLNTSKTTQTAKLNEMKTQATLALKQTTSFVKEMVQVTAVSELEERRRDQTRLFMAIAGQMINQASWLTDVTHENGTLTIKGRATDHEVVAAFLDRLEQLSLLTNVALQRAARDQVLNNVRLVSFEIKATTVFPEPTLMSGGLPEVNLPPSKAISDLVSIAAPDLVAKLQRNKELAKML
jgi:Tfp pilus assembly protein PilN